MERGRSSYVREKNIIHELKKAKKIPRKLVVVE